MATRFYGAQKFPNADIKGYFPASVWDFGPTPQSYRYEGGYYLLSTSNADCGTASARAVSCDQQPNYAIAAGPCWISWPLTAQLIDGTFDLCWLVRARWTDMSGFSNATTVRYKVHVYISVGQSATVRHTLLNEYIDSVNFPGTAGAIWRSLASAQVLTPGSTLDGDCVIISVGFFIVSAPVPSVTYPPDEWTQIDWRGAGASAANADAVPGDISTSRNGWFEFSDTLMFKALSTPPANDTCANALVIGGLPYISPYIDTTQAPGTEREAWFTLVAPSTGEIIITTLGTTYPTDVEVYSSACGAPPVLANYGGIDAFFGGNRAASIGLLNAINATQYWIRVRNPGSTGAAASSGGQLRVTAAYRERVPQEDDLYLPAGAVAVFREGALININPTANQPLGIAIDYSHRPMENDGGSPGGNPHVGDRVLVGYFGGPDLIDIWDLPTLSFEATGGTDIDIISDPFEPAVPVPEPSDFDQGIVQLHLAPSGLLTTQWFGNGFLYVAETGTLRPAFLNYVPSALEYTALKIIDATHGDNQPGAPFPPAQRQYPIIDVVSTHQGDIDATGEILYYHSAAEWAVPGVAGSTNIRTYNLTADSQGPDFATIIPQGPTLSAASGLCWLPDGGLLLCNGPVVERYNSAGTLISTYTPTYPPGARQLTDVHVTADGQSAWTVEVWTATLLKFDLATMTEIAYYETHLQTSRIYQFVLYQPSGIEPPPVDCPGELGPARTDGLAYSPPFAAGVVQVADFADSPEGLERITDIVSASSNYTLLGWFDLPTTPLGSGEFRTFFYYGDDPATYSQGVWIGQVGDLGGPNEGKIQIFLNSTSALALGPALIPGGRYYIGYRRNGTAQDLLLNAVTVASLVQDQSAQTLTHLYVGTDTLTADWAPMYAAFIREFASALTNAQIAANMVSPTAVGTAYTDTPLDGNLLDDSGNDHDWDEFGGVIDFVGVSSFPWCQGVRSSSPRTGA